MNNGCNKNCFKKSNSKITEATGDSIGNRIADKIRNFSKKSPAELHSKELQNDEKELPKKDTYLQTKGNKFLMT